MTIRRRVLVPLSSRDSCEVELGGSSVVLQADVVEKQQIEDDAGSLMPSSGVMVRAPVFGTGWEMLHSDTDT